LEISLLGRFAPGVGAGRRPAQNAQEG